MKKMLLSMTIVAGLLASTLAETYTWTGEGANANWQTAQNWSSTPDWTAADIVFNSKGSSFKNYIGATSLIIKGITFDAETPDVTIRLGSAATGSGARAVSFNQNDSHITVNSGATGRYVMTGPGYSQLVRPLAVHHNGAGILELQQAITSKAAFGINKDGSGTLILSGANTYLGPTKVKEGCLMVNNNTGSGTGTGAVTVESGGKIGGSGKIEGNLTLKDGARFAFDGNPKTTLKVDGELALSATFGIDNLDMDWKTIAEGIYALIANKGDFSTIENWGEENKMTGLAGDRTAWFGYTSDSKGLALTVVQ